MTEGEIITAIISDNPSLRPLIAIIPNELLEFAGAEEEVVLRTDVVAWLNQHAEHWALKAGPYYEPESASPDTELRAFDIRWLIEFSNFGDLEHFTQQWKSADFSQPEEHPIIGNGRNETFEPILLER